MSESVLKSLMSFRKAVDIRVDNCRKLKNNQTYNGLLGFKQALAGFKPIDAVVRSASSLDLLGNFIYRCIENRIRYSFGFYCADI